MLRFNRIKLKSSFYQFNNSFKVISTGLICIILFIIILSLCHLNNNYYNINKNKVDTSSDLITIPLTSSIKQQHGLASYIDHIDTDPSTYSEANVTGFVSNLDETFYMGDTRNKLYKDVIDCRDLEYNSSLKYQINELKQDENLIEIRREIIHWQNELSQIVTNEKIEKTLTEQEIVDKHWFEFGHVSVWVESYQCYLMYSRVIYTLKVKNVPEISFIKATAYDKDWNEIKGKQIPYLDVVKPDNFKQELEYLDTELKETNHHSRNSSTIERRRRQILDKYYITYPTILKFSFKTREKYNGPEDPHVILKQNNDGTEEPIIIFTLDDGDGRKIHSILPHRRTQTLVKYFLPHKNILGKIEKNWSPFLVPDTDYNHNHSLLSRGYLHFVHTLSPLRILRCSLDDGSCEEEFNGGYLNLSPKNRDCDLRGGTQFVPLPNIIPSVTGKNIWVSFAKTHTKGCGCGPDFYRPVLVAMIEQNSVYHLELIAPGVDFGIEPLNFGMTGITCKGANVLTPNSIVSWFVASQDPSTHSFQDYMTVTVSEADAVTKRVVVNGVLDYILGIYNTKHIKETFSPDDQADSIIDITRRCVKRYTWDVCRRYGRTHPK